MKFYSLLKRSWVQMTNLTDFLSLSDFWYTLESVLCNFHSCRNVQGTHWLCQNRPVTWWMPLALALQGPHLTTNFWNLVFKPVLYPSYTDPHYSNVMRLPFVSTMSASSPWSEVHGNFSLLTLLPWFPLFHPFISSGKTSEDKLLIMYLNYQLSQIITKPNNW